MGRIYARWELIAAVWLAVLILSALAATAAFRWRRSRSHPAPLRDSVAEAALFVGTLPWLVLMVWPTVDATRVELVPLRDLAAQLGDDPIAAAIQITANLVVFAPLGFFGPIRWPALRSWPRLALLGFGGAALVELTQFGLRLGRVSSVDDVLLNGGGMVLAAVLSRRWWASRPAGSDRSGAGRNRRHPARSAPLG
ncbi:hypothetical protein F4553_004584 [Allocatelliglobosispora scoriae]|uniref:VanZ-like domain-containing protein n=1 Tax=Allocatelliglobosispora scoriae TaxID=643052 RepID=A0A841BU34_9ACTN|nr:VanZ family protein [Allocatelliglobosispora scoriae]MBB5871205.1 hypothetical protein [Allocatelliglobosispora scoriae]